MKKIFTIILGALLMLTGIGNSFGQVNIIPIRTEITGFETWTDTDIEGTTYLQLKKATASTVSPAMNFDNYTGEALTLLREPLEEQMLLKTLLLFQFQQ
jgi:hypothetical protein